MTASFALQLIYMAVMSRLLEPADFGLVAAAVLGLRLVSHLSRFGLGSAVVQRPSLSEFEERVAFTLSLSIAVAATALGLLLSPAVAALLGQSGVTNVMRWMSLSIFLTACSAVPEGLIRRRMRFRALSIIQVLSAGVGYLGVGIPLALRGWGVWSLVASSIAQAAVQFFLVALLERGCIRLALDRTVSRSLLTFGGLVAATGVLEFLSGSIDTFAVARWNGAAALGQYSRATTLVGMPIEQATNATSRVLLPSFASVQNDDERFTRGLLTGVGLLSLVVMVPAALASAASPVLVSVVLGSGWGEAARVLPALAPAYGVSLLIHVPAVAAEARGLVGRKFVIQLAVLAVFLGLVGFGVAVHPTLLWFALAWSISEIFRMFLYLMIVIPGLGIKRGSMLRRYGAAAIVAAASSIPAVLCIRVAGVTGVVGLVLAGAGGAGLAAVALLLPSSRILRSDLRSVIKR